MPRADREEIEDSAAYILATAMLDDPDLVWRRHRARLAARGFDRICYAVLAAEEPERRGMVAGMLHCADPDGGASRPLGPEDDAVRRWVVGATATPPCQPGPAWTQRFTSDGTAWRGALALGTAHGRQPTSPGGEVEAENAVFHLRMAALPGRCGHLTPRQLEVLEQVALGATTREVAARLNLTPTTVEKHLRLAREALGARNTTHAVFRVARQLRGFGRLAR